MDDVLSASMAEPQVYTLLLAVFAALGGHAGSDRPLRRHLVQRRSAPHELGIRVALGAARENSAPRSATGSRPGWYRCRDRPGWRAGVAARPRRSRARRRAARSRDARPRHADAARRRADRLLPPRASRRRGRPDGRPACGLTDPSLILRWCESPDYGHPSRCSSRCGRPPSP